LLTHGSYYWLPFDAIAQIGLEPVQDLRDLVWLPCEVTLRQGTALQGFMPVRYPLVPADDDATRLSRRTQWSPLDSGSSDPADASGHVAGHGQRTWVTDTEDFPMLQARKLTLETVG
jgi:type VI secretion system protein ImpE